MGATKEHDINSKAASNSGHLAGSPMGEARDWLDKAIARIDELSVADQQRLLYLEQRSADSKEVTEDVFHSANNALFVMNVELQLLTRHLAGECTHPEVKRWLAILKAKIDEIKTVNQRLFAAEAGGGPLYVIHSFISFQSVVQRTLDVYEDVARKKRISISWTVPEFAAVTIWSDAVAIGTVLDNLVSNAIKFSHPGKAIKITISREGKDIACVIRDEGPGLSKTDVARVFQRGVPLSPKPTGGESSTGYGLAIARDIVRKLGGRIWCESTEGQGTTFGFSLPADPDLPRRARPANPSGERRRSGDAH
ncbi:MAG TPA: HAMP domain-containing sensor histidine kinase [Thermoanaerobaculia bacterium]|nr:HAMP domain-containing sensor histidine kinase [Thermoanaerobaculia bacterium]